HPRGDYRRHVWGTILGRWTVHRHPMPPSGEAQAQSAQGGATAGLGASMSLVKAVAVRSAHGHLISMWWGLAYQSTPSPGRFGWPCDASQLRSSSDVLLRENGVASMTCPSIREVAKVIRCPLTVLSGRDSLRSRSVDPEGEIVPGCPLSESGV